VANTSANHRTPARPDACVIYAKPARRGYFHWGWHSADGRRRSRTVFAYFYDCLTDARLNGYKVDPAEVAAQLRDAKLTIQIVPKITVREPQT
jgi:hypothetical protein